MLVMVDMLFKTREQGHDELKRPQKVERVMGIEPTLEAWEAAVLPLNYTRRTMLLMKPHYSQ